MTNTVQKLLLAAPRGYCAGVDRAVQTVERALEMYGAPVYVRKEIVHNKHVVSGLRERGAVFVDEQTEVPAGAVCVFSAHGVAPSVRAGAQARGLQTIDATCPLVTKVHREAVRFAGRRLHGRARRPRRSRGGRRHDGRGARADRARAVRAGRRRAAAGATPSGSPTSPRRRSRSTKRARSSRVCASAFRASSVRAPTTSATPRPTARRPSSRWPPAAI